MTGLGQVSARSPEVIEFRGEGGVRLVADAVGPHDGPPVLLLRGGGQTRHAWTETAATLAEEGWRGPQSSRARSGCGCPKSQP
jgi:pimeloyl-ACP methyl ester carboxylesterase